MKYLGIDYGSKRIGIAISNPEGTIAFPRSTLLNEERVPAFIVQLIKDEKIERIVVGDTRSHGGGENPITKDAERFMSALADETGLKIESTFEVFSSIEASRYAPETKQHDDSAAAAIILQRFLDMNVSR